MKDAIIIIGMLVGLLLIYTGWIIRCIQNAYEERTVVTEDHEFEVNENGILVETRTAKFHTI